MAIVLITAVFVVIIFGLSFLSFFLVIYFVKTKKDWCKINLLIIFLW